MSDLGADVLAKRRVEPALSVSPFSSFGLFIP